MTADPTYGTEPFTATQVGESKFPASGPAPSIARFEIFEALGQGGMGIVYRARDRQLGRIVALKTLLTGSHLPASARERFERETKAIAQLQHPQIAQLYEAGEEDSVPWFAMELLPGGSLDQQLRKGPLGPESAARLVEPLARAIGYCHRQGIIHRDLKPGNVLFSSEGTPKITDFGIAKQLTEGAGATKTGDILGTPSYMAPEQASGVVKQLGPTSDVYSLGAILYHCLTGAPPFRGPDPVAVMMMALSVDPVPPGRIQAGVPRDLEIITLKCLEKNARQRYATSDELADDLGRYLRHEPILAHPLGIVGRLSKWARRHPGTAMTLGTIVLAVCALVTGGLWYQTRLRAELNRSRQLSDAGRTLANWLLFDHAESLNAVAATPAKEAMVDQLLRYLQAMEATSRKRGDFLFDREMAAAYERVAEVLGDPTYRNLGRIEEAVAAYQKALIIRERLVSVAPGDDQAQLNLLDCRRRLAVTRAPLVGGGKTVAELERVTAETQVILSRTPRSLNALMVGMQTLSSLAEFELDVGKPTSALEHARSYLALTSVLAELAPAGIDARERAANAHLFAGRALLQAKDYREAAKELQEALRLERLLVADKPELRAYWASLSQTLIAYGDTIWELDRIEEACKGYEEAERLRRRLVEEDPKSASLLSDLLVALDRMGYVYQQRQQPEKRIETYREYVTLAEQLREIQPGDMYLARTHVIGLTGLAEALLEQHQATEAE
ncbi:MAG TPA: protein kinase, partial [Pirellulaceae bacterium]